MNKRKAIRVLTEQKRKLVEEQKFNRQWIIQTSTSIENFFGKESSQFIYINKLSFEPISKKGRETWDISPYEEPQEKVIQRQKEAIEFLDNCIEIIKTNGIKNSSLKLCISYLKEIISQILKKGA